MIFVNFCIAVFLLLLAISRPGFGAIVWVDLILGGANLSFFLMRLFDLV